MSGFREKKEKQDNAGLYKKMEGRTFLDQKIFERHNKSDDLIRFKEMSYKRHLWGRIGGNLSIDSVLDDIGKLLLVLSRMLLWLCV